MLSPLPSCFLARLVLSLIVCLLGVARAGFAQGNGHNLTFQGLLETHETDALSAALAGAMVSRAGGLYALTHNPAGLETVSEPIVDVSFRWLQRTVRENGVWLPGAPQENMWMYLDGRLVPEVSQNGLWSSELGRSDSPHAWDLSEIEPPVMGVGPYDARVADFENQQSRLALSQLTAAWPLDVAGHALVVALAYRRPYDVMGRDWNGTHLDPRLGSPELPPSVDTLRTNWSVFNRERTGGIHSGMASVGLSLHEHVRLGVGVTVLAGETEDRQSLDRVGYFLLLRESAVGDWSFSYEQHHRRTVGTSSFSGAQVQFGLQAGTERFTFGARVKLPYTLKRDWTYETTRTTAQGTTRFDSSGVDRAELPATVTVGMSFRPIDRFTLALDYERTAYSNADVRYDVASPAHPPAWADQQIVRLGLEYQMLDRLALLGGYQSRSEPFVPTGNAVQDRGPITDTYAFGFSWNVFVGQLAVAYEYSHLKYYDLYVNNRNYALEAEHQITLGYAVGL